jgi:hypothetical protein
MYYFVGRRTTLLDKQAASTSEVGRLETGTLRTKSNLTVLMMFSGRWIDTVQRLSALEN